MITRAYLTTLCKRVDNYYGVHVYYNPQTNQTLEITSIAEFEVLPFRKGDYIRLGRFRMPLVIDSATKITIIDTFLETALQAINNYLLFIS